MALDYDAEDTTESTKIEISCKQWSYYGDNKPYLDDTTIVVTSIYLNANGKFVAEYEWNEREAYYPTTHSRRGIASTIDQALKNLQIALNSEKPDWENELDVETD